MRQAKFASLVFLVGTIVASASVLASDRDAVFAQVAQEDKTALYTLLDIDQMCGKSMSADQLSALTQQDEFVQVRDMRTGDATGSYFEKVYSFSCPPAELAVAP